MRPFLVLALATVLLAQAPQTQQDQKVPDDLPTIKVDVDVVSILASVRDKRNSLVPNLEQKDFTVLEDGKPQPIKYFTRETDLPLTIGLLIDVSGSQLIAAMRDLRVSSGVGGFGPGPVPTIGQPRGTVLYDAVYLAANEKLKTEVGRKVIVVITDGVDEGSRLPLKEALAEAQKADAVIYSIEYEDPGFYSRGGWGISLGGGAGASALHQLSDETGGHVYRVDRRNTLDVVFKELQDEMRSQYSIGYTPINDKKDGTYRKLDIKLSNKDLKAQARKGYYAIKPEAR